MATLDSLSREKREAYERMREQLIASKPGGIIPMGALERGSDPFSQQARNAQAQGLGGLSGLCQAALNSHVEDSLRYGMSTSRVDIRKKEVTLREELQKETNEWLKSIGE